ncbi:TetR/AcrR family transcriptional regulator [Gordonibacter massiliensis (ex Traore et al. 2017)]|uniref:TetR/AcrR family transcriptional regulator n=1 Tax=Gordonibacter massiliensis (ex Traore et al. 2017) TaxID=1841863 RepID=UPI001C8B758F|nr:TetR/AcrR family transcriptional regulator [Gordonibacter massiliensis (ex Traore et al. 2017)]
MQVVRTVKDPEERRLEILDTAMRLFMERGYDAVSMRDIARAADVTPGLAYHYFDSKQKLFAAALEAYAAECTEEFLHILDDGQLTLADKMDALFAAVADEEGLRYHDFFHAEGNRAFHEQLSFALCERMYPHLLAAVKAEARRRGAVVRDPEVLVNFITYGQLGLMSDRSMPDPRKLELIRNYVEVLMESQTEPA